MKIEVTDGLKRRFWAKVRKFDGDGCWLWSGALHNRGYGYFNIDGKMYLTHRVSWLLKNGTLPADLLVCHRCDVKPCVRPDHLFLGTHGDNLHDAAVKGLMPRGDKHPMRRRPERSRTAILTKENVVDIRAQRVGGKTVEELARDFGLSKSAMYKVVSGTTWKNISIS